MACQTGQLFSGTYATASRPAPPADIKPLAAISINSPPYHHRGVRSAPGRRRPPSRRRPLINTRLTIPLNRRARHAQALCQPLARPEAMLLAKDVL